MYQIRFSVAGATHYTTPFATRAAAMAWIESVRAPRWAAHITVTGARTINR